MTFSGPREGHKQDSFRIQGLSRRSSNEMRNKSQTQFANYGIPSIKEIKLSNNDIKNFQQHSKNPSSITFVNPANQNKKSGQKP